MNLRLLFLLSAFYLLLVQPFEVDAKSAPRFVAVPCAQVPCSDVGRFQLFQGEYTTFDLNRKETYTHQGVFMIDSVTGKVKRYINKIDEDGRYIETWVSSDLPLSDKKQPLTTVDKEGKQ